jgi:hypothetical protein
VNPTRPGVDAQSAQAQEAARAMGLQLHILSASREPDFDAVFLKLLQLRPGALVISADALFNDRRDEIIALAKHYSVPTIYEWREAVAAGGLISYGTRGFAWTHRSCNVCHLDMLSWERGCCERLKAWRRLFKRCFVAFPHDEPGRNAPLHFADDGLVFLSICQTDTGWDRRLYLTMRHFHIERAIWLLLVERAL